MINAAIFDLDGTLVDLPVNYDELFKEMKRILNKENVRPLLKTIREVNEKERRQIFMVWDEMEQEAFPKTAPVEEGMAIYKEYYEKPKALITMQGENSVTEILKSFDLSFAFSITRETSTDREEQLAMAVKKLKTDAHSIMFVGNEDHDKEAARKVGCQFRRVGQRKSGMTPSQAST